MRHCRNNFNNNIFFFFWSDWGSRGTVHYHRLLVDTHQFIMLALWANARWQRNSTKGSSGFDCNLDWDLNKASWLEMTGLQPVLGANGLGRMTDMQTDMLQQKAPRHVCLWIYSAFPFYLPIIHFPKRFKDVWGHQRTFWNLIKWFAIDSSWQTMIN